MSNRLTEEQIRKRGIISDVARTLDDSEHRQAAGHWRNTSGTRVYCLERVELAEELIRSKKDVFFVSDRAHEINSSFRPFTPAICIIDYRTILKKLDPDLKYRIWRERLCHPVAGRRPGSAKREELLIKDALLMIARHGYPEKFFSEFKDVEYMLKTISLEAEKQFAPTWPHIIARKSVLRYGIYRGKSPQAARRILGVLSLIQTGRLNVIFPSIQPLTLLETLSEIPTMRIDHKVMDVLQDSPTI